MRLEEKLEAARAALRQWPPEQMARAGALVRLDHPRRDRGRSWPHPAGTTARRRDGSGDGSEAGGRGAMHRTCKRPASESRPEFSEKLMRDLTAHRTAAIQAALMQNPRVALVTLVHRMAETVFGLYGRGNDVVKVHVQVTGDSTLAQDASDYANSPAAHCARRRPRRNGATACRGTPKPCSGGCWRSPRTTLLELLAYCTARSVNAVVGRARALDHSDAIAEALGVDMADWWVPTAANYLGSVSKAKALEAVKEATGNDCTQAVAGMKKPEAVRTAPASSKARAGCPRHCVS